MAMTSLSTQAKDPLLSSTEVSRDFLASLLKRIVVCLGEPRLDSGWCIISDYRRKAQWVTFLC